jgi:hypothetical protein
MALVGQLPTHSTRHLVNTPPTYADNAAAIAGGLVAGDFYVVAANDSLAVVV